MKYVCDVCGWEYDKALGHPEGGIAPGIKWEDIPDYFECPLCSGYSLRNHTDFRGEGEKY